MKGAVYKRRHQSRGMGFTKRWSYLVSLFSESDDEGGKGEGQKSLKIDDFFNERSQKTSN